MYPEVGGEMTILFHLLRQKFCVLECDLGSIHEYLCFCPKGNITHLKVTEKEG